ncbi:MAG: carbohydrate ABC transporter permease [Lachnospiraceae bacterium]|nr:carbohydrate ABC transporter permease [Lachnospiraceae bacterium]
MTVGMDKNARSRIIEDIKSFVLGLGRWVILIGVAYVIVGPVLGIISRSFFSDADNYNTMVYMIPQSPTLERYEIAFDTLNYSSTAVSTILYSLTLMVIQVLMCSMVGYGFARYDFPFKKVLFGCVVVMIIIPTHTIMLPLYMTFANFDFFGILGLITGSSPNLLGTVWPMYILTFFACGLRSGLYIYIFNQFFRGLPKEIEEAAYVDGCGVWYTYFRIMLRNAVPSVVTVAIFSLVWQYNDTFYAKLFNISDSTLLSKRVATLASTVGNVYKIFDPNILQLYMDAGIVLVILPLVIIYVVLQKQFIEGVERSGIVG